VRYYIALGRSFNDNITCKTKIAKNISSYSLKLKLLTICLPFIPFKLLSFLRIGYFVDLQLDNQLQTEIDNLNDRLFSNVKTTWNIIVGSYVHQQKIVIQLFTLHKDSKTIYIKIGDHNSEHEMLAELNYLENPINSTTFINPSLLFSKRITEGNKYNIQATQEFRGVKIDSTLTDEIYKIFKEIACCKKIQFIDGFPYYFSHGDFTPWNMKKVQEKIIVFDWEYCAMRFYGYDLIHFQYQIEIYLNNQKKETAINRAIEVAQRFDDKLKNIEVDVLKMLYLNTLAKTFGNN
jgi:thiamine kinase-like enzyme